MISKPVACLRHEEPDDLGVGRDALPIEYVDLWREDPPALGDIAGLIVLGGEMNADQVEDYPFLAPERELLRRAVKDGIPVLGICLGAQLLARALGAPVARAPVRELGFLPVTPTAAARGDLLAGLYAPGDTVFQWHEDTWELPREASLLLTGRGVRNQAFRAGPVAWGFQFHLEIDRHGLDAWLDLAGSDLERDWGTTASGVRRQADRYLLDHEARGRELFDRFGRLVSDGREKGRRRRRPAWRRRLSRPVWGLPGGPTIFPWLGVPRSVLVGTPSSRASR
ncbi:MAG: type 1 glutamine amidotransferase [Actinomycetota bacterium]